METRSWRRRAAGGRKKAVRARLVRGRGKRERADRWKWWRWRNKAAKPATWLSFNSGDSGAGGPQTTRCGGNNGENICRPGCPARRWANQTINKTSETCNLPACLLRPTGKWPEWQRYAAAQPQPDGKPEPKCGRCYPGCPQSRPGSELPATAGAARWLPDNYASEQVTPNNPGPPARLPGERCCHR